MGNPSLLFSLYVVSRYGSPLSDAKAFPGSRFRVVRLFCALRPWRRDDQAEPC